MELSTSLVADAQQKETNPGPSGLHEWRFPSLHAGAGLSVGLSGPGMSLFPFSPSEVRSCRGLLLQGEPGGSVCGLRTPPAFFTWEQQEQTAAGTFLGPDFPAACPVPPELCLCSPSWPPPPLLLSPAARVQVLTASTSPPSVLVSQGAHHAQDAPMVVLGLRPPLCKGEPHDSETSGSSPPASRRGSPVSPAECRPRERLDPFGNNAASREWQ